MEYDSIIESILFASGDPFPVSRLSALLDISEAEVLAALRRCQPDTMAPLEAMSLLYELKNKLK